MPDRVRPVISVAIATRNYGRYLPRALDSVLRCQNPTNAPIQIVVADDASTDHTRAILAEYRRRCPENLEVVLIRTPSGIGAAKNAALDRCRGRTVAILDADDEFLPEKLLHCHQLVESGAADIVTTDFYHQIREGHRILRSRRTWGSWRSWGNWFWPPSTWVFRNGAVRFNPHSLGAEDVEWLERRWSALRHRHLHLPLSVQHVHLSGPGGGGTHYGLKWDSLTPAFQLTGRILGPVHEYDQLAPPAWICRSCGNQYLLPARCCGRPAVERPLLFYWTILSPYHPERTEFSLVMLTRNGLPLTRRAVGSLLASIPADRRREVELIFVDGFSTDGTVEYVRELAKTHPVKLILTHPEEPFNYARACNRGAHAAVGKYLLLLNNDIELRSNDPWTPLRAALSDPRVGVAGATVFCDPTQWRREWPEGSPPYRFVNMPLTGDFWGTRREVYWELGGIDEAFSGYGYDELDFEFRAQRAHYHLAGARVLVYHEGQHTFSRVYGKAVLKELDERNHQLFQQKHGQRIRAYWGWVGPFSSHRLPARSFVIVARNEGSRVRETLTRAARDPGCRNGSVQLVVVDNGSTDDTALLLEAYRRVLPHCLSAISLPEPVALSRARRVGEARAVGHAVQGLSPGDWPLAAAPPAGGPEASRPAGPRQAPGAGAPDEARARPALRPGPQTPTPVAGNGFHPPAGPSPAPATDGRGAGSGPAPAGTRAASPATGPGAPAAPRARR